MNASSGWSSAVFQSRWFSRALAVLAGTALALSFPKPSIAGLAWIAPALLLIAARDGNAFRLGYLAGLTHYLISLSWLLHIPVRFFPILGWIALAAFLALYIASWTWLCTRALKEGPVRGSWRARTAHALFCAVAWIAMEMIIARLFSGFPWNLLGASQHQLLPLIQIASVTGIYGVAFLVVWFAASLFHAVEQLIVKPGTRHPWLKELALPVLTVAVIYAVGLRDMALAPRPERAVRIALVQPSIPQTMVWDPSAADERFSELLRLTEAALTEKPDVLLWPEAAVPKMVRDHVPTLRAVARLAISNNVWLIVGSDDFDFRGTNTVYFNSSFLVSPHGELVNTYRKRRLVIFGEYVPLAEWLPFLRFLTPITGGFTAGERPITFELGALDVRTSVLICFEDVFPHYAREHVTPELDFLVNITNDGWFGESAAQWQHAASAVFRAVENGVPLVRCANNGVSCWIDVNGAMHAVPFPDGRSVYAPGYKIVKVPVYERGALNRPTIYNRYGDWFGWTCVAITGVALAFHLANARRTRPVLPPV